MLRLCFLVAFVMSAAMSLPQDEVLPETSPTLLQLSENHPELKHATPKDAAHAKIKMLQDQGFDNTQCNQMATDAISGMTTTLQAAQSAMTALSTGADCLVTTPATRRLLGVSSEQQLLDTAATALVASKADLAAKELTLAAAIVAPITLTINLNTIGNDLVAIGQAVAADPAVAAANQAVTTAQGLRDAANLVAVADQATFDTATTAAQDASKQCLCNANDAHKSAWASAQQVVSANTQAWKEAHHVKCAVDGTADDACNVPSFTVTDQPLVPESAQVTGCPWKQGPLGAALSNSNLIYIKSTGAGAGYLNAPNCAPQTCGSNGRSILVTNSGWVRTASAQFSIQRHSGAGHVNHGDLLTVRHTQTNQVIDACSNPVVVANPRGDTSNWHIYRVDGANTGPIKAGEQVRFGIQSGYWRGKGIGFLMNNNAGTAPSTCAALTNDVVATTGWGSNGNGLTGSSPIDDVYYVELE